MRALADPARPLQAGRAVTALLVLSAWLAAIFGTSVAIDPVRTPAAWSPFEAASVQQGEALRSLPADARNLADGLDLDGDQPARVSLALPGSIAPAPSSFADDPAALSNHHPAFRARAPPAF